MQKVIHFYQIQDYSDYIDQKVINYINDGQIETYENFDTFDLIAFDYYDFKNPSQKPEKILIYIDHEDLFYFCEGEFSYQAMQEAFVENEKNDYALYLGFKNLLKGSSTRLDNLEDKVSLVEDRIYDKMHLNVQQDLIDLRYEVSIEKKYFDHLQLVFEEICDNDSLISKECLYYFKALRNRTTHLASTAKELKDYIIQVGESFKSQIAMEESELMKVFTFITSIFMPLSLIAGWYGMNVKMPEFNWDYGYLFVIGLCAIIMIFWYIISKKKKWF